MNEVPDTIVLPPDSEEGSIEIKKPNKRIAVVLIVVLIIAVIIGVFLYKNKTKQQPFTETNNQSTTESPTSEPEMPVELPGPTVDSEKIETTLNNWYKVQTGTASVTIMDENGEIIAEVNGRKTYFTASIYKLYVAYIGYQKIDDGTYSLTEPYLNGWSRGKCLDEMIRTSHSPCAEKMWNELGKENLTSQLKTYGLKDTSMTGLVTSSRDAAIILARIHRTEGLSAKSAKSLLDSMLNQIYRDALPAGVPKAKVYDKVGFNGQLEYHDTGIIRFNDKQTMIVSVLTSSVGSRNIKDLAARLNAAL